MSNQYAVIMAGGRGERFWPKSRLKTPKHLISIVGNKPMLQQTIERLGNIVPHHHIFVITSEKQLEGVRKCCATLSEENIVAEPVGRDTAAVVGLAAILVKQKDPNGVFAMLPADQVIHDVDNFRHTLVMAFELAAAEPILVTLGIKPTYPATGYGYIQKGEVQSAANGNSVYRVKKFVEKPDSVTAEQYLKSGDYFWNAGMFVWSVSTIGKEFRDNTPELYKSLEIIEKRYQAAETISDVLADVYPNIQKISIDYAIMEKSVNVATIAASFDWDDVGTWPTLERHVPADKSGNIHLGDVITEESNRNIVISDNNHLTALIGVDDLIIVQTDDATLICAKDKAQEIKKLVRKLETDPKHQQFI